MPKTRYAGVPLRLSAVLLDLVILSGLFFPLTRIIKGTWIMSVSDHRWNRGVFVTDPLCLLFLLVMFIYFVLLEGTAGATLGKWLCGLRVVRRDGGRAGMLVSLLRNVLRVVDGLPFLGIVGAVLMTRSAERARFGDRIAQSRVIRVRPGR